MATCLGGGPLVEHQSNPHACFCYIYMWNIVWNMKHKNKRKTHIYMRNIVWNIKFINFHESTYIYMRNIVWNIKIAYAVFKKSKKQFHGITYIYMRNIVWNIDFSKNLKHF